MAIVPRDNSEPSLGDELVTRGWAQGSLFYAHEIAILSNAVETRSGKTVTSTLKEPVPGDGLLVLATQTCDINRDNKVEPYIEALLCRIEEDRNKVAQYDASSTRYFVIDKEQGLIAVAPQRVILTKEYLLRLKPLQWPSSTQRRRRFAQWLGRRFDRPAVPDDLERVFDKVVAEAFKRLKKKKDKAIAAFNNAVREIRVNVATTESPPFPIHMTLLLEMDSEELTTPELTAISEIYQELTNCIDSSQVLLDEQPRIVSPEEMSVAEYEATRPVFLDYLSYEDDSVIAPVPIPGTS